MPLADLLRRAQPFVGLGRRHPDVDDGDIRLVHRDMAQQVLGIPRLCDDVEACVPEQARDAFTQEHRVIGEYDAYGRGARARAQGREVAAQARLLELEDSLGLGQVGQQPEAEVAQFPGGRELGRGGLRDDDLTAVAGGGDPVGAVDVDAHVAVLGERCGAGVQADPGAHGRGPVVAAEPALRVGRRRGGLLARREDGEQLVSARVDLVPRRSGHRLPQEAADVCEDGLPVVAELARQARRALDVGEEEGEGAGREGAHARSLGGDVQKLGARVGCVGERVIEGLEGSGPVDGDLEGRLAREVEHLDGDAVVLG